MKKVSIIAVLIFSIFTSSLFSLEWGGLFNNTTVLATADFKNFPVNQSNGVFMWLKSSLNKEKTLNVSAEAVYKYSMPISNNDITFQNIVDLNLLKFSGSWSLGDNTLSLDVGRFSYSDIAGAFFIQNSDGLYAKFGNLNWNVGLYGGYTGLLNRFTVGMQDLVERTKMNQIYDLCYAYVPIAVDFTLANIKQNSLSFQLAYFLDTAGGKKDKAYFDFVARGPLGGIGGYSASIAAGTAGFKNVMLFSSFDLTFYVSNSILASFGTEYASGDHGVLALYTPITYRPVHSSQSVIFGSDAIVPRLTAMFLIDKLCVTANEKIVMSISKKGFKLNGFDTSISGVYNIFSDLQVSCNLGAYVDLVDKTYNNFNVMLNVNFTF